MNFGKSVVGAVVGGLVGLVAHVGLEYTIGEASWFSVVTGLITGLAVRKFDVSTSSVASYTRGGLTALIALCAIFGGIMASSQAKIAKLASAQAAAPVSAAAAATKSVATEVEPSEEAEETAEEPSGETAAAPEPSAPAIDPASDWPVTEDSNTAPTEFSVWDFVFIAIGVFLAYECARGGSSAKPKEDTSAEPESAPAGDAEPSETQPES